MSSGLIIGSRVSITASSDDTRYEGTVTQVDSEQKTVRLDTVRIFGTEDRVPMGPGYRPPMDTLYEFVIFKGGDIKDITVLKNVAPQLGGRQPDDRSPDTQNLYGMPYNNPNGFMFQQNPAGYPYPPYGYNYGPYGAYGQPSWGMGQYPNYGVVNYPPVWQGVDGLGGEGEPRRKDAKGPESDDGSSRPFNRGGPGMHPMQMPYGMQGLAGMYGLQPPVPGPAHSMPPGMSVVPPHVEQDSKPAEEPEKQPEVAAKKPEPAAPAQLAQQAQGRQASQPQQKEQPQAAQPAQPAPSKQKVEPTKAEPEQVKSQETQSKQTTQAQSAQVQPQQKEAPKGSQSNQSQAQKKQQPPQRQQKGKTATYQPKQQDQPQKQEQQKQEQLTQEQKRQEFEQQRLEQQRQRQQPQKQQQQTQQQAAQAAQQAAQQVAQATGKPTNPWAFKGIGAAVVSGKSIPVVPLTPETAKASTSNTTAQKAQQNTRSTTTANNAKGTSAASNNKSTATTVNNKTNAKTAETAPAVSKSDTSESWRSNGLPTSNPWGVPPSKSTAKPTTATTKDTPKPTTTNTNTNTRNTNTNTRNTNTNTSAKPQTTQAPTGNPWNRGSTTVVSSVAHSSTTPAPRNLQELDISANNERWNKDKFFADLEAERERVEKSKIKKHRPVDEFFDSLSSGPVYDPEGDFFDTLSSEVLEDKTKKKPVDKVKEFNDQKKTDINTFGLADVQATYAQLQAQFGGGASTGAPGQSRPTDQGSRPPANRGPNPGASRPNDYTRSSNPTYNKGGRGGGSSYNAPADSNYKGRHPIHQPTKPQQQRTGGAPPSRGPGGSSGSNTSRGGRSYASAAGRSRGR